MLTSHCLSQLKCRGINIPINLLNQLATRCQKDTALILCQLSEIKNDSDKDFYDRKESNGDLVIAIIRKNEKIGEFRPITIMFRRSNQKHTPESMGVSELIDIHKSFEKEILK